MSLHSRDWGKRSSPQIRACLVIFTIEIVREGSPDVRLIEEWSTESSATLRSYLGLISKIFVTSRIDCCCSLLAGVLFGTLARLDRVLRSAARLVGGLSKFSSITAYMRDVLHWLPISERIQ